MLVSTKGRYALRIMVALGEYDKNAYIPLPIIADKEGISEKYLESIVSMLTKAGYIEGLRGKGGGYRLKRELSEYSVGEILRSTEKSLAPVACLDSCADDCERSESCTTLPMWKNLDTLINNYLDSISLADISEGTITN